MTLDLGHPVAENRRKIAEYSHRLQLMGFVRLRALSHEEATERELALQKQHHNQQEQMLDIVNHREAELQQKIAAEQARRQAAEMEKQKLEEYNQLILQSKQDKDSERWDEAIASLEKAEALYPEKSDVALLKAECLKAKSIAEYNLQAQKEAQQKFCQPLSEVIKGKTSAGNLVGTTVKWLKVEGHSYGSPEQAAFISEAQQLNLGEKKKLKSKLSDLEKIVGKENVERIRTELGIS